MTTAAINWFPEPSRDTIVADAIRGAVGEEVSDSGPATFPEFVRRHNPTLWKFEHVPKLAEAAEQLITGQIASGRLLVIMPPRYFKTEVMSRLLPAYFLRKNPGKHVGLASYGAELAWSISEESRNFFVSDGGVLSKDTSAKKRWRTTKRGEMWAAGTGGPLLGFGYNLGVVDDPTDPEKAESPVYIKRFQKWWPAKFLSRQQPGAKIVFVMQRLGMDDPVDFLFRREVGEHTDLAPENWHVLLLDEIKSDEKLGRWSGPLGLPPTCTLAPDDRAIGEVLAPSHFSPEQVEKMQRSAGALVASAQRQGRPMRPTGDFWRLPWFRTYKTLPEDAHHGGRDWDTAYTKEEANSASAHVESYRGLGEEGVFPIYVEDVDWEWLELPELVAKMRRLSGLPHYVEQKASGKSVVQALAAEKIAAEEVTVKGGKFARAAFVQPTVSSKRVWVREELLHTLLYGERQGLLRVTSEALVAEGADLDLNDAFVQAITRHIGLNQRSIKWR